MLAGATALAALVFGLLALTFRRRRSPAGPVDARRWIGGLGLAMPLAVLSALLGYALAVGTATLATPAEGAVGIGVTARRYGWAFRYPNGATGENRLHLPAGRPVDLRIGAADVIHSLWIPRLAGKMDAVPGHQNVLRVVADRPGVYRGVCAEYCGPGHRNHGFTVVAHDAAGWAAFLANPDAATGPAPGPGPSPAPPTAPTSKATP